MFEVISDPYEVLADYSYTYKRAVFKDGKLVKDGYSDETWVFETVELREDEEGEVFEHTLSSRKETRRTYNADLPPLNTPHGIDRSIK